MLWFLRRQSHFDRGLRALTSFANAPTLANLDNAVRGFRESFSAAPSRHRDHTYFAYELGRLLAHRFEKSGSISDADEAVLQLRTALAGSSPDNWVRLLAEAEQYQMQALTGIATERTGNVPKEFSGQLDGVTQRALDSQPGGDTVPRHRCLSDLANALEIRYAFGGDFRVEDIDKAVALRKEALSIIPKGHPDFNRYRSFAAHAIHLRSVATGLPDEDDNKTTMQSGGRAWEGMAECLASQHRTFLRTSAVAIRRFEQSQNISDLEIAIRLSRQAVIADQAVDESLHVGILTVLSILLTSRYRHVRDISDIDEAAKLLEAAAVVAAGAPVATASIDEKPVIPIILTGLGIALDTMFSHSSSLGYLEKAVSCWQQAEKIHSADSDDHFGYQFNLGVGLANLARESNASQGDHEKACQWVTEANKNCPDSHPRKPMYVSEVARLLCEQFRRAGNLADINEAVRLGRKSVELTHDRHRDRVGCWSRLAGILGERYKHAGIDADTVDIDESIQLLRWAVDATRGDEHNVELMNLGVAYTARYERLGEDGDRTQAIGVLREVACSRTARPSARIGAAHEWGYLEAKVENWQDAATAHELAVELLGQAAPHTLARRDQERAIGRRRGLASDAAACFLNLGDAKRAVELLEQGRGILLGRAIEARSDLTELAAQRPDLAERFERLRTVLDSMSDDRSAPDTGVLDNATAVTLAGFSKNSEESDHSPLRSDDLGGQEKIRASWDELLAEIRGLADHKRFQLAPEVSKLVDSAKHGPIVIVNVSQFRSDAIILDPTINDEGVGCIELPGLSPQSIDDVMMAEGFTAEAGGDQAPVDDEDDDEQLRRVLRWLWDTVASKVLEHLRITAQSDPSVSLPRLWWCPTGSLSFLPIHAAGYYDQQGGPSVFDCVVSSYTPTVRALLHARDRASVSDGSDDQTERFLVVSMPHVSGWADLPGAESEARFLRNLFPDISLLLEGSDATYGSVGAALQQSRFAHFSCHAVAEGSEPSAGRLVLSDHEERPLTVRDISRLNLDRSDLAFLSACASAAGGGLAMADESIHLASAFQLAGFPRVIATLAPVFDSSAKKIVRGFYTALADNVDPSQAAQLLHDAIREYRTDRRQHPSMWAFFIHAGA